MTADAAVDDTMARDNGSVYLRVLCLEHALAGLMGHKIQAIMMQPGA